MDANLGYAVLRTRLEMSGLTGGLGQVERAVAQTSQRISTDWAKVGQAFTSTGKTLSLAVTVPLTAISVGFIKAASDAQETAAKFGTVFRDVGDQAERTADRLADSFGLSSTNARRLLGDTGDLLTGFGFTAEAALDLSTQVQELAVDLASFTNYSGGAEGASAALTKALLGETESAKSLGIVIRQDLITAKVEQLRAEGKLIDATDQQAKAYAALAIAQEQSKNAIGDYARTSDSFANQLRLLRSNVNDLAVTFGETLLPVATKIVSGLGDIVKALASLPEPARNAIIVVSGLAAAAGPLLIAIGSMITALPKIAAGIGLIKIAAAGLFGPAGILIGAVGLVGGLALAFSGRGDSLDAAVDRVGEALGSNDPQSITESLVRLRDRVDESAVPAIQRLIDKMNESGEVSAELRAELDTLVSGFDRFAAEAELASVRAQIATLEAQGLSAPRDGGDTGEFLAFRQDQLNRALVNAGYNQGDLRFVLDEQGRVTLQAFSDAVRSTRDPNVARVPSDPIIQQIVVDTIAASRADQTNLLTPLLERQAALERQLAQPARVTTPTSFGGGGGAGGAGGGGGGGELVGRAAVEAIFAELGRAGGRAINVATRLIEAGVPETDAVEEQLRTRINLVSNTIDTLLRDYYNDVTDAEIEFLVDRRRTLQADLDRLLDTGELPPETKAEVGSLIDPGTMRVIMARTRDAASRVALDTLFATLDSGDDALDVGMVTDAYNALRVVNPLLASEFDDLIRVLNETADDLGTTVLDPGTVLANQAKARLVAATFAADTVQALQDAFERGEGIDLGVAVEALERLRELSPNLARDFDAFGRALIIATRAAEDSETSFDDPANRANGAAILAQIRADATEAQRIALDTVRQLGATGASVDDIRAAFEALGNTGAALPDDLIDLFLSVQDVGNAAQVTSRGMAALASSINATGRATGQRSGPGAGRPIGIVPEVTVTIGGKTGEDWAQDMADAGIQFRNQVIVAGAQFAAGLIESIRSGDVGGAIQGAFNLAGGVAGAGAGYLSAAGAGASFLGLGAAAIPGLGLAAALLPIVGGILGGLFGRDRRQAETVEGDTAEARRMSRTPSFVVRINVSQANYYGTSNADPKVRADNDRRTRELIAESLRSIDYAGLRRAALGSPL